MERPGRGAEGCRNVRSGLAAHQSVLISRRRTRNHLLTHDRRLSVEKEQTGNNNRSDAALQQVQSSRFARPPPAVNNPFVCDRQPR